MFLTMGKEDAEKKSRIRVLLVDDNEVFLRAVTDFLRRQSGFDVVGAVGNFEQAITEAQHLEPQVILVGLDGIGLEAIAHFRKTLPDVEIIALTLAEGEAYRQAVRDAGANELVSKASLITELLPTTRRVVWDKCPL
jgi:DNA-binding NarL/FixJ family response regulator